MKRSSGIAGRLAAAGVLLTLSAGAAYPGTRPAAEEKHFVFAGIEWMSQGHDVVEQLGAKGYRIIPGTRDAVVGQGRTFDHMSIARASLDDSLRVVRWEVTLVAENHEDRFKEMKPVYDQVVTECKARYGQPWDAAEKYKFPYDKGDGRETDALKAQHAMIHAIWRARSGDRLVVEMNSDANVVLTYTCPGWQAFEARVRHRKARDL
jgi:hypothetical protein